VLRPADGSAGTEVADFEPNVWGQRLELLTVVRALESLDQPSQITLIGCTHYVEQGILFGLPEWRENGWRWECFGKMVPVRDSDLWQRMDQVLKFHRVDCGQRRFDGPHGELAGPHWAVTDKSRKGVGGIPGVACVKFHTARTVAGCVLLMKSAVHLCRRVFRYGSESRNGELRVQGSGFRYS
jgi:hypothetical protein